MIWSGALVDLILHSSQVSDMAAKGVLVLLTTQVARKATEMGELELGSHLLFSLGFRVTVDIALVTAWCKKASYGRFLVGRGLRLYHQSSIVIALPL